MWRAPEVYAGKHGLNIVHPSSRRGDVPVEPTAFN
jgi:hypothetical protein